MIIVVEPLPGKISFRAFGARSVSTHEWRADRHAGSRAGQLRDIIRRLAGDEPVEACSFHLHFGGDAGGEPARVTDQFIAALARRAGDFPLYIPSACAVLGLFVETLKDIPQFAFFETSFFSGLPASETLYPLAHTYYRDSSVVKQGYHGIFHGEHAKLFPGEEKIISVVLDRQTTVCAIAKGKPVAVSLGYTPLEGIMSAKSCGDIDPGIIVYLMKEQGYSMYKIDELLKKKSGFLGMTGFDLPLNELATLYGKDEAVTLAFDVYRNQILKYIGDYMSLLRGLGAIVFAGCYAGHLNQIIYQLAKDMAFLGINLDEMPWNSGRDVLRITSARSQRHFYINALDESDIIRRETETLMKAAEAQRVI